MARKYAYEVVAQFQNRDAGYIGTWRTKDEARTEGRKQCQRLPLAVRRVLLTPQLYARLFPKAGH